MKQALDKIRESIKAKNCRPWIREFKLGDVAGMGVIFTDLKTAAGVKTMYEFDAVGAWEIIEGSTPGMCAVWALFAVQHDGS